MKNIVVLRLCRSFVPAYYQPPSFSPLLSAPFFQPPSFNQIVSLAPVASLLSLFLLIKSNMSHSLAILATFKSCVSLPHPWTLFCCTMASQGEPASTQATVGSDSSNRDGTSIPPGESGGLVCTCQQCGWHDESPFGTAARECFQCGSQVELPDTALAEALAEACNCEGILDTVDNVLDMIEHSAGYMEECIAHSKMVEDRIAKVYDNANNMMNDTALHLQSLFHGLPSTRGCQAERRQRLATLRERFEAEIGRVRVQPSGYRIGRRLSRYRTSGYRSSG